MFLFTNKVKKYEIKPNFYLDNDSNHLSNILDIIEKEPDKLLTYTELLEELSKNKDKE